MDKKALGIMIWVFFTAFISTDALAQADHGPSYIEYWPTVLEIPLLFMAVYFSFRTASALRGGVLGTGMTLLAWGFLIMGIGHAHMQLKMVFGIDIFAMAFGDLGGRIVWVIALMATWGLSALGLYKMYKASSQI